MTEGVREGVNEGWREERRKRMSIVFTCELSLCTISMATGISCQP